MEIREVANDQSRFPHKLLEVKPSIKKLWYRGELREEVFQKTVAVVGSRRMSRYGRSVIEEMVPRLCESGYTIVSGLMYGVDQLAHKITLECGGRAIAVLGYGIERANDSESDRLADEIVAHGGVVISEYPGDTRGQLWTFPQRNRIVVGLSDMVVIVEAGIKSGTMSTARWAQKMGKPIYAVPGNVFARTSEGANHMIEVGMAKPLTTSVLDELAGMAGARESIHANITHKLSDLEGELYMQLEMLGPQSANELSRVTGYGASVILPILVTLEMKGYVNEERGVWQCRVTGTGKNVKV